MQKTSSLYNARLLAFLLKKHGVKNIIVSPGSRNAPLIIALRVYGFNFYSIPDERAAAFSAVGMALADGKPAAVICTSGSAAANYLPAVTEAYYQKVPLLVITADRPKEWIGQGVGQTIQQENIFGTHVLYAANFLREPQDDLGRQYNQRIGNEALIKSFKGPVHLNVPFDEPLYDTIDFGTEDFRFIRELGDEQKLSIADWQFLNSPYLQAKKVLIIAGQAPEDEALKEVLRPLLDKPGHLLFTETLSNLTDLKGVHSIDRLINTISEEQKGFLQPDLVISFGGEIVSKMLKSYLKDFKPKEHWNLSTGTHLVDTFQALTLSLRTSPLDFFRVLNSMDNQGDLNWTNEVINWDSLKYSLHKQFWQEAPFSDFKVFGQILNHLPDNSLFHCANSASIRYAQLFNQRSDILHYANRGTSGIDGSTATAIGHALNSDKNVSLVTGDIAYLYDSGAFWNDNLPNNLKIIVLNNGGGNIFRIIKGPENNADFERFQETKHALNLAGVAKTFGISYQVVTAEKEIEAGLENLFSQNNLAILEIQTPSEASPQVLKDYFLYLKKRSHDF
jgi:2-succinyl-5-enolpyruvyl-6-hydroxy-3-cyclohexene-1-carboxylate synthase